MTFTEIETARLTGERRHTNLPFPSLLPAPTQSLPLLLIKTKLPGLPWV